MAGLREGLAFRERQGPVVIVLDTNCLIDWIRPGGDPATKEWLRVNAGEDTTTTTMSLAELSLGILRQPKGRKRDHAAQAFQSTVLDAFAGRVLPFTEQAAANWATVTLAQQRRGRPLSVADAIIVATTVAHGGTLVSADEALLNIELLEAINPRESLWDEEP